MFDIRAQKSMIGRNGWEIIKHHDTWIDAKGVNLGGTSEAGRRLQLLYSRGVVKNCLDGKRYLEILWTDLFNTNLDENLLAEDQID